MDVGGGTGFCTLGIVEAGITPTNITLIDQSPHQLAKAKGKPGLKGVTILEGDAEDLPFATDSFDRYVSAGAQGTLPTGFKLPASFFCFAM